MTLTVTNDLYASDEQALVQVDAITCMLVMVTAIAAITGRIFGVFL